MNNHVFIKDVTSGSNVSGCYLLKVAEKKVDKKGGTFLAGILMDTSGQVDFRVWDFTGEAPENGSIVFIKGNAISYKDTLQLSISELRAAKKEEYDLKDLIPTAPEEFRDAFHEIMEIAESISDPEYRNITVSILKNRSRIFAASPAAMGVHHAFIGGLAMHTLNMLRMAEHIAEQYGNVINRSLLLAGTALHDISKLDEFNYSPTGLVSEYSLPGNLLGHLVMGCCTVHQVGLQLGMDTEKLFLLEHLLISHHGQPEFGACKEPMCAEAYALSALDMLDSRMEIYREKYDEMEAGTFAKGGYAAQKVYKHTF